MTIRILKIFKKQKSKKQFCKKVVALLSSNFVKNLDFQKEFSKRIFQKEFLQISGKITNLFMKIFRLCSFADFPNSELLKFQKS